MILSDKGLGLIMDAEGFVPKVYLDGGQVPTVGFGHRVLNTEHFVGEITRDEGIELLKKDVAWAELWVSSNVKTVLSQGQFDSLVDFTFNCGIGVARKYILPLVQRPEMIPHEIVKHIHDAKGNVEEGLEWRRDQDVNLWLDMPLQTREEWRKKKAQAA